MCVFGTNVGMQVKQAFDGMMSCSRNGIGYLELVCVQLPHAAMAAVAGAMGIAVMAGFKANYVFIEDQLFARNTRSTPDAKTRPDI